MTTLLTNRKVTLRIQTKKGVVILHQEYIIYIFATSRVQPKPLFQLGTLFLKQKIVSILQHTPTTAASSADNGRAVACAHASMSKLEVLPGLTMKELFNRGFEKNFAGNVQIGRSGKLSSNKTTHFNQLKMETGINRIGRPSSSCNYPPA